MTKAEIESLIKFVDERIEKRAWDYTAYGNPTDSRTGVHIICALNDLFDLLRKFPTEEEKTCGANYQGMYEVCEKELEATKVRLDSVQFDMHNLSIEHAHYVGAVAAMETIFGRKFEPDR